MSIKAPTLKPCRNDLFAEHSFGGYGFDGKVAYWPAGGLFDGPWVLAAGPEPGPGHARRGLRSFLWKA